MRTRLAAGPASARSRRALVLGLDAIFGLALLVFAVSGGGGLSGVQLAPEVAAPDTIELTSRLGNVSPPGQSTGFAMAPDGSLALVDRGREVIVRLSADGQTRAEWGPSFGPGLDARDLVGLAADGDGWYVLDRVAQRIIRLDAQGRAQPERGIDLEPLATYGPNGLATDGRGNLFMADTGRDRIVVFDANGRMSGSVGESGTDLGKLKQPMFLAFGPDAAMFVTDWENGRIERFEASRTATNTWPVAGHAWGIAVDPLGRVFVPDADHRLVRMFGPDGTELAQFGGATPLPVDVPSQVAVSPDGASLWILGVDGLARADLTPYAGLRPVSGAQPARVPLAILGVALLALAAGIGAWPRLRPAAALLSRAMRPAASSSLAAGHAPPLERRAPGTQGASPAAGVPAPGAGWRTRVRAPLSAGAPPSSGLQPRGWDLRDVPLAPRLAAGIGLSLAALGLVVASVAEYAVASPAARLDPWPRMLALAVGSLAFAVGAGLSARALPWRWVADWPTRCAKVAPSRAGRVASVAGVVVGVLAAVAAATWWQFRFQTPEATRGALVWLAAVLVTAAATAWYARSSTRLRFTRWSLIPWVLFIVALVPRAFDNASLPYGVWFDEAEGGLHARRLLLEGRFTPITDTYGRDASLYYYLMAGAQALVKDPVLAQRLLSAIVGAACAPLIYFMGRELFGWRVGLAAGVLLAFSRWHLDVSRLGWDPISLPFCAILAIWLLARAVRTQRWTDTVWAGLAVGLGLHGYIGARALPIIGLLMLVYAGWWLRGGLGPVAARFAVVAAAGVVVALPVLIFAVQDPTGFNGRLSQTLILNEPVSQAQKLDEIWSNVQKHVLMFHVSGDLNGRHNLPGAPMLDVLSGLLAVLGLAVVLVRPFDWRSVLLVGWGAASMLGGIMTFPFEAPQAMRTLGVTPVVATFAALALVLIADRLFAAARAPILAPVLAALGALVVGAIAWINLATFFGPQMQDPGVWESFSTRETIPTRAVLESTIPLQAVLGSPTIAPSLQQQLLLPDRQSIIRPFDASSDLPYRGSGPAMVILETEHEAGLADEVARFYPDAARRPIVPPNGNRPTVTELTLLPEVLSAHRGLQASGDTWRGLIAVDVPGVYAFRSAAGGAAVRVDGAEASETDHLQLARGNHLLSVRAPRSALEWQTPGNAVWQPVDPNALFGAPDGGNGLEATFYPTPEFQGSPTEVVIDPILAHYYHTNPFARRNVGPSTWSVEWRGILDAPTSGVYRFDAERLSRAGLWIDGQAVFDEIGGAGDPSGQRQLSAGRHAVRVRLTNRGDGGPRLYLYWTPPGGARALVPGRALYPPEPSR